MKHVVVQNNNDEKDDEEEEMLLARQYDEQWRFVTAMKMQRHMEIECSSKYELISCRRFVNTHLERLYWSRRYQLSTPTSPPPPSSTTTTANTKAEIEAARNYKAILNKLDCPQCNNNNREIRIRYICSACHSHCHHHRHLHSPSLSPQSYFCQPVVTVTPATTTTTTTITTSALLESDTMTASKDTKKKNQLLFSDYMYSDGLQVPTSSRYFILHYSMAMRSHALNNNHTNNTNSNTNTTSTTRTGTGLGLDWSELPVCAPSRCLDHITARPITVNSPFPAVTTTYNNNSHWSVYDEDEHEYGGGGCDDYRYEDNIYTNGGTKDDDSDCYDNYAPTPVPADSEQQQVNSESYNAFNTQHDSSNSNANTTYTHTDQIVTTDHESSSANANANAMNMYINNSEVEVVGDNHNYNGNNNTNDNECPITSDPLFNTSSGMINSASAPADAHVVVPIGYHHNNPHRRTKFFRTNKKTSSNTNNNTSTNTTSTSTTTDHNAKQNSLGSEPVQDNNQIIDKKDSTKSASASINNNLVTNHVLEAKDKNSDNSVILLSEGESMVTNSPQHTVTEAAVTEAVVDDDDDVDVAEAVNATVDRQSWNPSTVSARRLKIKHPSSSAYTTAGINTTYVPSNNLQNDDLSVATTIESFVGAADGDQQQQQQDRHQSVNKNNKNISYNHINNSYDEGVLRCCDCCLQSDCRMLPTIAELTSHRKRGRSFIHWAAIKIQRWFRLYFFRYLVRHQQQQYRVGVYLFAQKYIEQRVMAPIWTQLQLFDSRKTERNENQLMGQEEINTRVFMSKLRLQAAVLMMNKLMNVIQQCVGQLSVQLVRPADAASSTGVICLPHKHPAGSTDEELLAGMDLRLKKKKGYHPNIYRKKSATVQKQPTDTATTAVVYKPQFYPSYTFSWLSAHYLQSYVPFQHRTSSQSMFYSTLYYPTECQQPGLSSLLTSTHPTVQQTPAQVDTSFLSARMWYHRDPDVANFIERFIRDFPYEPLSHRVYAHQRSKYEKKVAVALEKRKHKFMMQKQTRLNILQTANNILKVNRALTANNNDNNMDNYNNNNGGGGMKLVKTVLRADVLKEQRRLQQIERVKHKAHCIDILRKEWTDADMNYQQSFIDRDLQARFNYQNKFNTTHHNHSHNHGRTQSTSQSKWSTISAASVTATATVNTPPPSRRGRRHTLGDPTGLSARLQQLLTNWKDHNTHSIIVTKNNDDDNNNSSSATSKITKKKVNGSNQATARTAPFTTGISRPVGTGSKSGTMIATTGKGGQKDKPTNTKEDQLQLQLHKQTTTVIRRARSRSCPQLRDLMTYRQVKSIALTHMTASTAINTSTAVMTVSRGLNSSNHNETSHSHSEKTMQTDDIDDVIDLINYNLQQAHQKQVMLQQSVMFFTMRQSICEELYDAKYAGLWKNVKRDKFRLRIVKAVLHFTCNYFQFVLENKNRFQPPPSSSSVIQQGNTDQKPRQQRSVRRRRNRCQSISDPERAYSVVHARQTLHSAQQAFLISAGKKFGMRRRSRSFDNLSTDSIGLV